MQNPPENPPKIDDAADGNQDGDLPDIIDLVMEMGSSPSAPRPTPRVPARLEALVETATAYAKAASSENTQNAYAKDWRHFTSWCRREGFDPLPPSSQVIGLYIGACAAGDRNAASLALRATIERRLSGLAWNFTQRGQPMDRADRHISTVLAGIRREARKAAAAERSRARRGSVGHARNPGP